MAFCLQQSHLCLGEVKCVSQLDPFWCGKIPLGFESFLQACQLVVRKHGPCFPPPTMLGAKIARTAREQTTET
jgi:hypothetical protein